jgi:hypothetical protein
VAGLNGADELGHYHRPSDKAYSKMLLRKDRTSLWVTQTKFREYYTKLVKTIVISFGHFLRSESQLECDTEHYGLHTWSYGTVIHSSTSLTMMGAKMSCPVNCSKPMTNASPSSSAYHDSTTRSDALKHTSEWYITYVILINVP